MVAWVVMTAVAAGRRHDSRRDASATVERRRSGREAALGLEAALGQEMALGREAALGQEMALGREAALG